MTQEKKQYWLITVSKNGKPMQTCWFGSLAQYAESFGQEEPLLFATPMTAFEYKNCEEFLS